MKIDIQYIYTHVIIAKITSKISFCMFWKYNIIHSNISYVKLISYYVYKRLYFFHYIFKRYN